MKILHVCQWDDPDTGGAMRVCEALVHEQRVLGAEAWILFLYGSPGHLFDAFSPHAVCLGLNSSREAFRGCFALKDAMLRIAPDIIHSHDGILWPRLTYLNRKVPVVMHAHATPGGMKKIKDKLGWPLTKATTDCLIGISRHTIDAWKEAGFGSSNIHLVPNGVDFKRFAPVDGAARKKLRIELGLPEERRILVWVGRLHNGTKGTDRVEKVADLLPEGVTLVVVGQGPEFDGMRQRCKPHIERGRLIMVGSSPYPESYYKASDYYLFSSYQDAFGLVILEAVACNLPILFFPVTKGGGAVDLLREFGTVELDEDLDGDSFGKAIRIAEGKKSSAGLLRTEAMKSYDWTVLANQVLKVYESVQKEWRKSG